MSSAFEKCVLFSLLTAVVFHTAGAQNATPNVHSLSEVVQQRGRGERVQFSVSLHNTPDPPAEIVWTHNGLPINTTSDDRLLLSDGNLSLNISSLVLLDGGQYEITLNSSGEMESITFNLTVIAAPEVQETSPLTLAQRVSDSAQFSVSLLGTPDPPPEIVWTHNGLPINITSAGRLQDTLTCIAQTCRSVNLAYFIHRC
eukprot:scpid44041/ scgid28569/ 